MKRATLSISSLLLVIRLAAFTLPIAVSFSSTPASAGASSDSDASDAGTKLDGEEDAAALQANLEMIEQKMKVTKNEIKKIRDASYLPDLYFSFADLLVQKAHILVLQKIAKNPGKKIDDLDFTKEKRPKLDAIEIYQKIYSFFPKYDKRDKALFLKGLEHRDLGQFEDMVRTFAVLSREFPSSSHFNEANIIVGDYMLDVRKDYDLAIASFQRVAGRPLSPFTPIAYFHLGKAYVAENANEPAIPAFEQAIAKFGQVNAADLPELYRKTDVRRDAALALANPYVEVYSDPQKNKGMTEPAAYFQKWSTDHFIYRTVLARAGRRLILKEKWRESADCYYHVLALSTDFDARLDALRWLNESRKRKAATVQLLPLVKEVGITVDLLQSSLDRPIIFDRKTANRVSVSDQQKSAMNSKETASHSSVHWLQQLGFLELLMRDWATQLQTQARTTGSPTEFADSAAAYGEYLSRFPVASNALRMRLNRAESLFKADSWVQAGMEYEYLANATKKSRGTSRSSEFEESAVESYTKALQIVDQLSPIDKIRARKGLRAVGAAWIKENPSRKGAGAAAFNIANSWYEERNLHKAISSLRSYVKNYPGDSKVRDAIFLIMNSYAQLDDYKSLEKAGTELGTTSGLSAEDRTAIHEAVRRARTKDLQAMAGDFGTKEYAENLLSVASKYKGSALGVQALYEAYTSLRSKRDPELFDVGEALLDQHAESQYAKEVASSMATLALSTASFARAARYLSHFADRYPAEKESVEFRKTSALLYERQGDFVRARTQYQKLGDIQSVARMDFQMSDWSALEASSTPAKLPESYYWHALAIWRLKRYSDATPLLKTLASSTSTPSDESGHAKFLLAQLSLDRFRSIQMKSADDQNAMVAKVQAFQGLSLELQEIIKGASGRWPIAALYLLGQTDHDLGRFIADSPLPPGLSDAEKNAYMAELTKQASTYLVEADKVFAKCIDAAQTNDVFSRYVEGCRARGKMQIHEEDDLVQTTQAMEVEPPRAKAIRRQLFEKSSDTDLLFQLADVYVQADQPQTASGIYARILELDRSNPRAIASKGVCLLSSGDYDKAFATFKAALDVDSQDPTALWNLAGLYNHFLFNNKLAAVKAKMAGLKKPVLLHQWAKEL